jgi:hypothetical protein
MLCHRRQVRLSLTPDHCWAYPVTVNRSGCWVSHCTPQTEAGPMTVLIQQCPWSSSMATVLARNQLRLTTCARQPIIILALVVISISTSMKTSSHCWNSDRDEGMKRMWVYNRRPMSIYSWGSNRQTNDRQATYCVPCTYLSLTREIAHYLKYYSHFGWSISWFSKLIFPHPNETLNADGVFKLFVGCL